VTSGASPLGAVEWKRSSFAMRSFWPASSMMPSFSTTPKVFQNSAYSSGLFAARSSSRSSERLTSADLIFSTVRLFCSSSRDTLSGRSAVSTSPRMKRSHGGSSSAALSMMNTRLTYSCTPPLLLALEQVERRALGQVQQRGVLDVALDLVVRPGARILGVVGQVLVERLVVLVLSSDFGRVQNALAWLSVSSVSPS
jgi:hypothetical protein